MKDLEDVQRQKIYYTIFSLFLMLQLLLLIDIQPALDTSW